MSLNQALKIKFVLVSVSVAHELEFSPDTTIGAVKAEIIKNFAIGSGVVKIRGPNDYRLDEDHQKLSSYTFLHDEETAVISVYEVEKVEPYVMPEKFQVVIPAEHPNEQDKVIPIRVYKPSQKKPYLGGYRSKINGIVYHHASAQTVKVRRLRWQDQNEKAHRTTQTAEYKTRSTQSNRESGTQMSRPDLYLDGKNDKVLRPKTYFTAAELAELKERMVLQLQCAWRCYVARVRTQKKRDQLEERQRLIDEANQKKKQEAAELKQRNFERRKHPRTIEDFEILYNELESWRYNENKRIKGLGLPKVEEQKELQELLAKETKLLQTIDRLKTIAAKENKKLKVQKMLQLMSEPKKWELRTTDVAEVHTPFTTRSKELMDLYNGLISRGQTVDSRLEMLLHVKWTVKEFDCTLTRDLVDLIDRESDLLNRGRSGKSLEGLRKRIATLFLQFIETPSFNPEATRFQRVETNEPEKQPLDTRTRKFW